jgi:hypothetical protein
MDVLELFKKGELAVYEMNKGGFPKEYNEQAEIELIRLAELGQQFEKLRIAEIIARNCTAWDTSKDKKQGLLPEVYHLDICLYEKITGEKYNFSKACKKFHIGEW